ncbi:putative terminase subunit domain protein, partial [Escherichia coli EC1735]
CRRLFGEDSQG